MTILLFAAAATVTACGDAPVRAPGNSRAATRADARYPGWKTDFAHHSVALDQFQDGGPPRDGIPPIDHPHVVTQRQGDRFLDEREPVMVVEQGAAARAYPSRSSWRDATVPMARQVKQLLTAHRTSVAPTRSDLVFPGERGEYLDGSAVTRRYKKALEEAKLRKLRFHDLRHTRSARSPSSSRPRSGPGWATPMCRPR